MLLPQLASPIILPGHPARAARPGQPAGTATLVSQSLFLQSASQSSALDSAGLLWETTSHVDNTGYSYLLQWFILFSTEANQIGQASFNLNEFILTILVHLVLTHLGRNYFQNLLHHFPSNWSEADMSVGPQVVLPPFLSVGAICAILLECGLSPTSGTRTKSALLSPGSVLCCCLPMALRILS